MTRAGIIKGLTIALVVLPGGPGWSAIEQPPPTPQQPVVVSREDLSRRVAMAISANEFAEAARLAEQFLAQWPNSPGMLYSAARAYTQLGDHEKAAGFLFRSVERGFSDFSHLERDPVLEPLRGHPIYRRIIEARDEAYARVAERQLRMARSQFSGHDYHFEIDHDHRLTYAVALDAVSFREMRGMLARQADQLIDSLFEAPPDYYVLVAVPTPPDARRLIRDRTIGGIYEHDRRRLVARDTGMMLRHEFTHVMHYGHMARLNQSHALWVQEGIASLYESYEFHPDGRIRFVPNNRFNINKRFIEGNRAPSWSDMMTMSSEQFMERAVQTYPMVREIFRWLADEHRLAQWYRAYIDTYDDDRTGRTAFETVFDLPLEAVEVQWKAWVRKQPFRSDVVRTGDGSLGVQIAMDAINDGVLIEEVFTESAAASAGLRAKDVIVSIDDRPTRAPAELIEIIASHDVGDRVRVRYRREGVYQTTWVVLQPLRRAR